MPYDVLDRLEREIDELGRRGLGPEDWCRAADQLLRRVVPFDSSCWQTNDPTTSLITGHVTLNLPTLPDGFALVAANEYLAEDVNRFADLARAPVPVGVLSQATEGRPERSMRWREYMRPGGLDHELRIALVDRGQCWGSVMLLRSHGRADFEADVVETIGRLDPALARGIRRAVMSAEAGHDGASAPGLIMLDRAGSLDTLTRSGRAWLDRLQLHLVGVERIPPVLSAVAASARAHGSARARTRTADGQWLVLHSALLAEDPLGRVSVIVEPPRPDELLPLVSAAYGLTDRERTVTNLVLRGRSTQQIARALAVSPYTVQEHLTSVFDKVGVRSRGELVGQVFMRHCLPGIG